MTATNNCQKCTSIYGFSNAAYLYFLLLVYRVVSWLNYFKNIWLGVSPECFEDILVFPFKFAPPVAEWWYAQNW